jgi:hypothetical protein
MSGEILIDGPLATNALFGPLLAALTDSPVRLLSDEVGSARAALFLAGRDVGKGLLRSADAIEIPGLNDYYASWRDQAVGRQA